MDDETMHGTVAEALRQALIASRARSLFEEDGDVYICRPWACRLLGPLPGHVCQECYKVEAGDRRPVDDILACWKREAN